MVFMLGLQKQLTELFKKYEFGKYMKRGPVESKNPASSQVLDKNQLFGFPSSQLD